MTGRSNDPEIGVGLRMAGSIFGCLLLTVCAGQATSTRWVKAGADDAAISRELDNCRQQANAVMANQQGIDQDISATLGGNWQRSYTTGIEANSMNRQAAGIAVQTLDNCMRSKGFSKAG
jgi:hypothetical protein